MTAALDGVVLQWTETIEPYGLNFIEYRRVMNATVSASYLDYSPYLTLPITFDSANTRQFTVPKEWLDDGVHYEFRMAYPFPSHTYHSNSLVVKTFDLSSPYVSSVTWMATHDRIELMWKAPEHSAGLIGYEVRVSYRSVGNGDDLNPSWTASELTVLGEAQVDLTSTSLAIGCNVAGATPSACLSVYTIYYVEISAIREGGADAPRHFYISTTRVDKSSYDHSEVYIYSGDVFVTFVEPIGWVSNGTVDIGDSPFVGARIESPSRDLVLELKHSTVTSVAANKLHILMSHHEFESMIHQIDSVDFAFTSLNLVYDGGLKSMPLTEFCLLVIYASGCL